MPPGSAENRKTALVTGASAGIGAVFARKLAARGYHVVLVARRADRLEALARELSQSETLPADLTDPAGLERVAARARNVDLLVNNAGFGARGYFWEAPLATQEAMHRLHVMATMRLCHAALGGMAERRAGAIINVSSVAAFAATPGNVSYCSTKTWMNAFSEGLMLEVRSRGLPIRIQALCPGFVLSEFHDVMRVDRRTVPKNWWLDAEYVVEQSLRALDRGRFLVIPSVRYRIVVAMERLMPRPLMGILTTAYSRWRRI